MCTHEKNSFLLSRKSIWTIIYRRLLVILHTTHTQFLHRLWLLVKDNLISRYTHRAHFSSLHSSIRIHSKKALILCVFIFWCVSDFSRRNPTSRGNNGKNNNIMRIYYLTLNYIKNIFLHLRFKIFFSLLSVSLVLSFRCVVVVWS